MINTIDGKRTLESKSFRGTNCAEELLDFLPSHAVVYFHNLSYDMRMIAKHGITMAIS